MATLDVETKVKILLSTECCNYSVSKADLPIYLVEALF